MSWNHRVMRKTYTYKGVSETLLGIHEVYYNNAGQITKWTEEPIQPGCRLVEGIGYLKWELQEMLEALDKPILDYEMKPEGVEDAED